MDKNPYIRYKNIYVIPTFHCRIEFAKLVREAFFKVYPDIIAVELPNNVKEDVIEAIERIPYLSLIGYADTLNPEKMTYIPIDPGDSIIEAIRIGKEHNIPLEFIDFSVKNYQPEKIKLPDDYSLNQIGLITFYKIISKHFKDNDVQEKEELRDKFDFNEFLKKEQDPNAKFSNLEKDLLREMYMASKLLNMMQIYNRILLVVGMAHWKEIKYYLINAKKIRDVKTDILPYEYIKIYNIRNKDARFLLRELPYNTFKWMKFRDKFSKEFLENIGSPEELDLHLNTFDKSNHIREIILGARDDFEKEYKEFINLHRLKLLFQYTRNLSITEKNLLPSLIDLLIASKNVIDDDFAWKVLKKAIYYPFDDKNEKYETMKLSIKGGIDPSGRYIKLRRHRPYYYKEDKDFPLKKRPEEKYPGEWRDKWEEGNELTTCSYPPEDKIQEDYFAYLRKKAIKNLKYKRLKIEEFQSSIKDGIAIKETVRNWSIKKKIYVKNEQQIQGKIDTILIIFDEDIGEEEQYPYKLTWWAEHDMECDMAFYATNPGDFLIGPGISQVEVGGVLSFFPPFYINPIFESYMDYKYKDVINKAERLLKGAILYSREKYILYIADHPPRKYFYSLAGVKHRKIIHMPLDNFSKESFKTLRHMHILKGKKIRKIAHNYIFF